MTIFTIIGALFSGIFKKVLAIAANIPPKVWIAIGIVLALLFAWHVHSIKERAAWNSAWNAGWSVDHAAFAKTVADYRAAAAKATRDNAANVVRVKTEQTTITEKVSHDYETQLADSASRYDRLRAKAAGYLSHPGSGAEAGLPDPRETTCQTLAGTSCAGIPPLLKAAQDNTDQLVALQAWVTAQSAVDVNGSQ